MSDSKQFEQYNSLARVGDLTKPLFGGYKDKPESERIVGPDALQVACPLCLAAPGAWCVTKYAGALGEYKQVIHAERVVERAK